MSFRRCRRIADITQKEAAAALGVHPSAVAQWEIGKTSPRAALLPKIADLYGCTVDDLLKPDEKNLKKRSVYEQFTDFQQ